MREIDMVQELLRRPEVRLLTLTGPGGVGKTRLAIAAVADLRDVFPDGIWLVPLAAIVDPGLVPSAIAQAVGVRESGDHDLTNGLTTRLRRADALLLLDNLEQVLEAGPLVVDILAACPGLKVLSTSRVTLHLSGEHEFAVPPLSLPEETSELVDSDAVRLFVERVCAVRPAFDPRGEEMAAVAEICRRLDGLPLAIELAAVRVKILSPSAMLAHLSARLELLTGGPHDLPARQRTMRATIAWSHDLLTTEEQTVFHRLAIFAGGFTLEAAEAVAWEKSQRTSSQASNSSASVTRPPHDEIAALVDHHLIQRGDDVDGESRFAMLETIREFALDQLEVSEETAETARRHADFFLTFAEHAASGLTGPEQANWLDRLEVELENFRAALVWLRQTGDQAGLLRLAWALWRFWRIRAYFGEGRAWLEDAAKRAAQNQALAGLRAAALYGAGWLAVEQGEQRTAVAHGEASLAIARSLADQLCIARALGLLGWLAHRATDYPRARALMSEALAVNRTIGDDDGIAGSLNNLAITTMDLGAFDEAAALYSEAKVIFERLGNQHGTAGAVDNLGVALYCQGDLAGAETLARQALDLYRGLGAKNSMAIALDHVGRCAGRRNDFEQSWSRHLESLPLRREVGDPRGLAVWLEAVASLIEASGRHGPAARLLGSAAALREASGFHHYAHELIEHERVVDEVRAALGSEKYWLHWKAGGAMTPEQAITEATTIASEAASSPALEPGPAREPAPFGLTSREQEVLRLLARRYSDREVAEALFISPRTVGRHVAGIFNKLGVHSRREAAAIAASHRLV